MLFPSCVFPSLFFFFSIPICAHPDLLAPVPPVPDLPVAEPNLHGHAEEPGGADAGAVADAGGAEAELAVGRVHLLHDAGEGVDVDGAAQQALPEDDDEDEVDAREEVVHQEGVERQQRDVADLQERRQVQPPHAHPRDRRPRHEHPQLVQEPVHRVEVPELREGRLLQREQQHRRDPLVYRVLGYVD